MTKVHEWRYGSNLASLIRGGKRTSNDVHMPSRRSLLLAGLFYLGVILFGVFAQMTRMELIVPDDATATVESILASDGMLQAALVSDVLMCTCFVLLGVTCYQIFREVDSRVALIMLALVTISGAVAFMNLINIVDAVQLIGQGSLNTAESEMVLESLTKHEDGSIIAQILGWGPWLVPLGYLGLRSGFVPRAIGLILIAGGIGLMVQGFQYFLLPDMGDLFTPGVVLSVIGEFSVCGWFLFRGFKGFPKNAESKEGADQNDATAPL